MRVIALSFFALVGHVTVESVRAQFTAALVAVLVLIVTPEAAARHAARAGTRSTATGLPQ